MSSVGKDQDELREFGVTEASLAGGIVDEPFRRFMRFQVERARSYFHSGSRLAAMVHRRSRGCPIMLQAVYSRVLDYIEQAEYDVFSRRLGLSSVEKITLLVGTWARWLFPIPKLRHQ